MVVDFEKPETEMTPDELSAKYLHMVSNANPEQVREIESAGPISEDSYIEPRQNLYRLWLYKSRGVILPANPGEMLHHPV